MEQKNETMKKAFVAPKLEKIMFEKAEDVIAASEGNGDIGRGRGRGGDCNGVAYHRTARSFASGRNSGC